LAADLGIRVVEIRNDLLGAEIADGTPADALLRDAEQAGVRIAAINALQRFDDWTDARAAEASTLARYARDCGASALVLCPVNDTVDRRDTTRRAADLRTALGALRPILETAGVHGLIEPLGFAESALRSKRDTLQAVDAVDGSDTFSLLHDTFHHALAGESEMFPARTGLVHVSGVNAPGLAYSEMKDAHRVVVGPDDRLDTLGQLRALFAGGYRGLVSLEPFASAENIETGLRASLALLRSAIPA
jgi:2-keto-myo-inositol isomerase